MKQCDAGKPHFVLLFYIFQVVFDVNINNVSYVWKKSCSLTLNFTNYTQNGSTYSVFLYFPLILC